MLYLETRGYGYSQKRCEDVVFWFVKKYLPRYKLDITVNHRGLLREGAHGFCTVMDCDHRPREFEIEMHNRLDVDKYCTILTFLNTTRMQVIHFISKAILCFLTPGFDANKLSFCFGVHDVIRYLELSHQPEQR